MNKIRPALKEISVCAGIGGIITAFVAGAITSAVLVFILFAQSQAYESPFNVLSLQRFFSSVALAYVIGLPGGIIMGAMAALCRSWTVGGVVGGASYIVAETLLPLQMGGSSFLAFIALLIIGACADYAANSSSSYWIRRLQEITDGSPLKDLPASWHISFAIGVPLVFYLLFIGSKTFPVFWQHKNYIQRLGIFTTVARSYKFAFPPRTRPSRAPCQTNLKQVMLAIKQYEVDYDEKWPLTKSGGEAYGWADAIQPYLGSTYLESTQALQCQSEFMPGGRQPSLREYSDYWYNANLSGINSNTINSSANTISLGDGNDGNDSTDARYNYSALPPEWITNPNSPAQRHIGGANYAFADGHIKWLKVNQVSVASGATATFAVE